MRVGRSIIAALAGALLASPIALGQAGVLCSTVTTIVGYDGLVCFPSKEVSRGITFSLTYVYTQPFSTSPPQYQKGGVVHDSAQGICTTGTDTYGPFATPEVDLTGSGPTYGTYTQVWRALIQEWGLVFGKPAIVNARYTVQSVTFQAQGCCS